MNFLRLLSADLRRAVISKRFILSALLVMSFYILGSLNSFVECICYGSQITVFDMHDTATFSTFSVLNYVFCAFPYAASFASEYKTNYFRSVLMRTNKRSYAASKVTATAVSGVLCLICGELLYLIICSFFGAPIDANTVSELNTSSTAAYSTVANADLLINGNYILYFLLLAVTRGLIGSFLSLIALWVSVKIQNVFVINASPLLIYYFIQNFAMNIISLPDFLNIANIFDGEITVIDSRYMTLYSVLFALGLSIIIGFFAARGIEKKVGGE